DTIQGFEEGADAIDLSDLSSGYDSTDDLTDFITVTTETVGDQTNTVISINSDGQGSDTDQRIVVEGVDWVGSETDMTSILNSLITSGKIIDPDTGG
ncbi:MAG: type I secretion C-terminal target domain-containing protein, partial [Pseudomonadales bacterium]